MRLSACIIVKNEEKNLPRLLKSLEGKFDEIILVDTGSTDKTKEIAKKFGCMVIEHEWNGFADARNRAVREAKGDWLWHFDADFELEEEEYKKAVMYLKKLPKEVDAVLIGVKNLDKFGKVKGISSQIFIHRKGLKWSGKVHETVNANYVVGLPIYVNHYGYADYKIQIKKAYRNLELLREELGKLEKGSRDYNIKLFYLVQTYSILSYENKELLKKVVEKAQEFLSLIRNKEDEYSFFSLYVYNYLLGALERLEDWKLYESYLTEILEKEPPVPDFYLKAYYFLKRRKKDLRKALVNLIRAATILDEAENNPFKGGMAFATDRLLDFYRIVNSEDLIEELKQISEITDFIEDKWKEKKGKNVGLILVNAYSGKEKLKFLRKLALRYRDDEFVVFKYLDFLAKKDLSALEKELPKFSDLAVSLFFKAFILEKIGKQSEAFDFYYRYLELTKDPWVAEYLLVKYPELKREFERRTKKISLPSDNRN